MDKTFCIGNFTFRLRCPDSLPIPENFLKFIRDGQAEYTYDIMLADTLPEVGGKLIARREDLVVLATETGEARYIGVKGNPEPYGCYRETSSATAQVTMLASRAEFTAVDPAFSSLLALEKRMLERSALVLHTAYMLRDGEAILFSAASGVGKSTQAGLWQTYRGTRTVNGDRCLLRKEYGIWRAEGWPVCGSSGICHVESHPIRAIVMLSQAPDNRVERLTQGNAFTQIFSQITLNKWAKRSVVQAMDLVENLIQEVPVYHLACNISEDAVACLEQALEEKDHA